jgi:hypothetical protein
MVAEELTQWYKHRFGIMHCDGCRFSIHGFSMRRAGVLFKFGIRSFCRRQNYMTGKLLDIDEIFSITAFQVNTPKPYSFRL